MLFQILAGIVAGQVTASLSASLLGLPNATRRRVCNGCMRQYMVSKPSYTRLRGRMTNCTRMQLSAYTQGVMHRVR